MSRRKGRLPATTEDPDWIMRFVDVRSGTAKQQDSGSSVEVVIATENPIERFDESRDRVIHEVLLMEGIELRSGKAQIPIVDSHNSTTVRNVLGSVRNLRVERGVLIGDAFFASDEDSQEAYQKLLEGHLTDFSITARPKEAGFLERGQTFTKPNGEVIEGPARIVTSWQPINASLCATGADEDSTVRRSYTDIPKEIKRTMNESLLQALVSKGMPGDLTDPDMVIAWVVGNLSANDPVATEVAAIENADTTEIKEEPTEELIMNADEKKDEGAETVERSAVEDAAIARDLKRQTEIRALCDKAGIERSIADDMCTKRISLDKARTMVLERMVESSKPLGQTADVRVTGASSHEKFIAAARDGLVIRSYSSLGTNRKLDNPAPGHEDFQHVGLRRLSEQLVARMGGNVNRMNSKDIAMVALEHRPTMDRFNISRDAYHSTGSLPSLMLDASNKTLLAGYDEAPYTWSMWARQAASVADFKSIHRVRFSEVPDPEIVPENHDYPDVKMSDERESYAVDKYGNVFTVTWETVVNDDLDAISRIPAMHGAACRRKQNQTVYGVLTDNGNLVDGGALFNSTAQTTAGGHANLASSGAGPTTSTLNTAFNSMMTKKGLGTQSKVILNVQPAFIIMPSAISGSVLELLSSIAPPSAGGSAVGNSNVNNLYGPNGDRPLTPIVEPVLDSNSTTAWYLAARNMQIDTVELSFLQGEESPVVENEWDFKKDCWTHKVRQTWGVAAIDFRGLYKNPGA